MKKIVCFGEIMMRLNPQNKERFIQADNFAVSYSGAEANVCASLANFYDSETAGLESFLESKKIEFKNEQFQICFVSKLPQYAHRGQVEILYQRQGHYQIEQMLAIHDIVNTTVSIHPQPFSLL